MTSDEGGPAGPEGGDLKPTRDDRDRDHGGITDKAAMQGEKSPPGKGGRAGTAADNEAAIDLDLARDRAS
jgi:hypothetical protein